MIRKRIVSSMVFVVVLSLLLSTGTFAASSWNITVNSATNTGAIKYGGIGWLYGLGDNTMPSDTAIRDLVHPQWSCQMAPGGAQHTTGDAFKTIDQAVRTGMKGIDIYLQDYYATFPYPYTNIDTYINDVIKPITTSVKNHQYRSRFRYVPFNEPDWNWYGTSGTKLTNLCNDWKKVYQAIKAIDSTAVIIGPNFSGYNASAYDTFFSFATNNSCLPDVTSWHELGTAGPSTLNSNYSNYRSIEAKYGISAREVTINEYGRQTGEMARPGRMIQYLARLERLKISGECSAWGEIGYLDDLISRTDNGKTGGYHLYRWYGQATGNTCQVVQASGDNANNQAMAFRNGTNNVKVIFGGSDADSDVFTETVTITGLSGTSVPYTVYGTDYSTVTKDSYTVSSGTATISGGKATINVSGCKGLSAYMIQMVHGKNI